VRHLPENNMIDVPKDTRRRDAILEAPAFVSGLDDVTMMGEPVEKRRRHLGVAGGGSGATRQAEDIQYGSGRAVHQRRVHRQA
jgi:hypothetical protein